VFRQAPVYPLIRETTSFRPLTEKARTLNNEGRLFLSWKRDHLELQLGGVVRDLRNYPRAVPLHDSLAVILLAGTVALEQHLSLEWDFLPRWRGVFRQSWEDDREGLLHSELPTLRWSWEIRREERYFQDELLLGVALGVRQSWGAVHLDGTPFSSPVIPYFHISARKEGFELFWAWHNPFSQTYEDTEGLAGMHREEILGVRWRLFN
jgi:hypothetical protein